MMMRKLITCFFTIIVMLIFLQHHLVASLSPNLQKTALFQFKQSLTISNARNCYYYSYYYHNYYEIPSHPKTMNWSMSSDYCTWEGVSCEHKTGDVIGLDLSCSQLEGAILPNSTLFQLSHLQFLNLSQNDFSPSNQFPQEFGFFAKGLTHLNLSNTGFSGIPSGISHLYKLVSLDLSDNYGVELEDEVFKSLLQNLTKLRVLNLRDVNLFGPIPKSIGHLGQLTYLGLSGNNLNGPIPTDLANLTNLTHLSLSLNNFTGPIPPSLFDLPSLESLHLSHNGFTGQLYEFDSSKSKLRSFDCRNNLLNGSIPPSLFDLPSSEYLYMSDNGFSGQLYEFDSSKSKLRSFDCSNNSLNGSIPQSFSRLVNLTYLAFSSNNFSGVLDLEMFSRLEYLQSLDLSHNSLSVRSASMATLPPKLSYLGLSSCNMKEFPHFSRDAEFIDYLDLSNNQIEGEIPHWIGVMSREYPYSNLNISHNRLTGGLEQLPWNNIEYLDLHSNMLNGSLPTLICNSSSLRVLNLSHNKLSGALPVCPLNLTGLEVFDLQMNNIHGNLPSTLSNSFYLTSINLHGNKLIGRIPSSFAELNYLETLDLGSNQISDTFPQCLEALPNLQVLVLKSNKFHGIINKSSRVEHPFPSLRIIDLSYNEFSGPLPAMYFKNFKAMMNGEVNKMERSYMGDAAYYSDSTSLVIKGVETELVRILTIFTTIDVSKNNFEGEIAECMGNLVSLRYINLSHNHLTGHIPSVIGKLSMLESLDLSSNQLEGEIPPQLTSIYTLASLNLSCNQLSGRIPEGSQFNTYDNDSYVGNFGLCGDPLSKKCENDIGIPEEEEDEDEYYFFSGFTWEAVVIGYGCGVVPAFIIGYLMLLAGKPKWFAGIIAIELGLKIRRMEIRMR